MHFAFKECIKILLKYALGLYYHTLLVGHKSCILGILTSLSLQNEFQNCVTNNVFWTNVKLNNNNHNNALPLHHRKMS